jgi:transcriptional regulator with XRE-family HTH domain
VLGAELRKARLSAGLTQESLAAKARLSREYVNMLERDKKSPTVSVLIRLCRAMNASAGRIITRVETQGS